LKLRTWRHRLLALALLAGAGTVQAADPVQGGQLYAQHCASCHGANGISVMPGAPNFARKERVFQADAVLLNSVKYGKNAMPGFVGMLRDQQILDIISYIRTIR
jgi:cytochrome c6